MLVALQEIALAMPGDSAGHGGEMPGKSAGPR
jgi:hypothetical protein